MSMPQNVTPILPPGSWILITGLTGFVASHVAGEFLTRGYRVRGTVRSLSSASWLTTEVFPTEYQRGDLELFPLSDLSAPQETYDAAVRGTSAIIHAATTGFDVDPNKVIPPVVGSVEKLLAAAEKEGVQRFVYTSSVAAALLHRPELAGTNVRIEQGSWNDAAVEIVGNYKEPYDKMEMIYPIYCASKALSEKAVWKYAEEKTKKKGGENGLVVNTIVPACIMGRSTHKSHLEKGTSFIKVFLDGKADGLLQPSIATSIADLGLLHVAAVLDPDVQNKRLIAWGSVHGWGDVLDIMKAVYPERAAKGEFEPAGKVAQGMKDLANFDITADDDEALDVLQKWNGKNEKGWTSLKEIVQTNMESIYEFFP